MEYYEVRKGVVEMKKNKGITIENGHKTIGFNIDHVILYEKNKDGLTIKLSSNQVITVEVKDDGDNEMVNEIEEVILRCWRNGK